MEQRTFTTPPSIKKRPYRRTKRPAGYNDKSSITTTTKTLKRTNAYDAVLAESQDLIQAAAEAQALGRLKTASSYLLLVHARLVGLGKRYDLSQQKSSVASNTVDAAQKLCQLLPEHIQLDTAMMEHLAKAAAELHAARTGKVQRQVQHTHSTVQDFLSHTANNIGVTNAATAFSEVSTTIDVQKREEFLKQQEEDVLDNRRARKPATAPMNTVPDFHGNAKAWIGVAARSSSSSSSSQSGTTTEQATATTVAEAPPAPSKPTTTQEGKIFSV